MPGRSAYSRRSTGIQQSHSASPAPSVSALFHVPIAESRMLMIDSSSSPLLVLIELCLICLCG